MHMIQEESAWGGQRCSHALIQAVLLTEYLEAVDYWPS